MEILNLTKLRIAWIAGQLISPNNSLTVIVKGTFTIFADGQSVSSDRQLFPNGDESHSDNNESTGSVRYESDFAPYKPHADLLLAGKCHTPDGQPVKACRVTFRVGSHTKTLAVLGDRWWKGDRKWLGPTPFTEMDLRYENSFGGEGYKANPVGKGHGEITTETEKKIIPLQNIEDPRQPITSRDQRPVPAGFGPLGRMWAERFGKVGTYNKDWVKERWPAFPKDFDWSHFNAAPADMQVQGYLRGDEELYFENLHPTVPQYRSRLPGIRVRCFLNENPQPKLVQDGFREVTMNLDTLWVDMEAEKLVLVWRGVTPVRSEDYEEIQHAFILSEELKNPPASLQDCHHLFLQHLAGREAEEAFAPEAPEPVAEAIPETEEEAQEEPETQAERELKEAVARAEAQIADLMAEHGIDIDQLPPMDEAAKKEYERILKELDLNLDEEEETGDPAAKAPWTRERVKAHLEAGKPLAGEDLCGLDLSGLWMKAADLGGALLVGARLMDADLTQADLSNADLQTTDLSGANLASANLAGATMARANASKAILKGGNLSEANLSNAYLAGADFCEANLTKAIMQQADLTGANFTAATLESSNLAGIKAIKTCLKEADITSANLTGANLTEANLDDAIFEKSCLREGLLDRATAVSADFSECDLSRASLKQGMFDKANFSDAVLIEADFQGASLKEASVQGANGQRINMDHTDLTELRASENGDFSQGSFKAARGKESIWSSAKLDRADFSFSEMERADFTSASLREANLYAADMKFARFVKARLQNARLVEMNLFQGSLEKADLSGADLSGSNMYGVEFLDAKLAGATGRNVNVKMTKLDK
jgi:uncharacterized protein YjbI with pentapeptide repeats